MTGAKNWCFTLNNYNDEDIQRITALEVDESVVYCVIGKEVGASGTRHLQGFIQYRVRKSRAACVALCGQAHFTVARRIPESIAYCKKDGDFIEIGSTEGVTQAGKRSDLDLFKEDVVLGNLDLVSLRELHSDVFARFPRFCLEYVEDHKPKRVVQEHPLRDWQQRLFDILNGEPDDRKVIFVVDYDGNSGKTWFAHYYVSKSDKKAQVLLPGKKADMAYTVDSSVTVLFVDAPRSKQGEYLQYDFLEEVKNGYVFSSKYESRMKMMQPCHVVVSMNEDPDLTKLSADRYQIIRITDHNILN